MKWGTALHEGLAKENTCLKAFETEDETNRNGLVYADLEYLKFISLSFPGLCLSFKVKMFRVTFIHIWLHFAFCS